MRLKGPFRKIFGMSKADHGQHAGQGGIEYDVPFVHQNHVNLCGDSSAQMLLLFNGKPASIGMKSNAGHANSFRLKRNVRGVVQGGNDNDLVATLKAAGLRAWNVCPRVGPWTAELVRSTLETYGPYAQSVQFSVAEHWVVVTGIDGNNVIYHDPWRGQNKSQTLADWLVVAGDAPESVVAATEDCPGVPHRIQATLRH